MRNMETQFPNFFVISLCGGSGAGKSTIAKALCERIGIKRSTRIPADYYIKPCINMPLEKYFSKPLEYDWDLIDKLSQMTIGQHSSTPNFDFSFFKRISLDGGRSFTMNPLVVIDAMLPYPKADFFVLVKAPDSERRSRIIMRDGIWETAVIDYWNFHQRTYRSLTSSKEKFDCVLDTTLSIDANIQSLYSVLLEIESFRNILQE